MYLRQELNTVYAFVERSFNLIKRHIAWEGVFLFYNAINVLTIGFIAYTVNGKSTDEMVLFLVLGALFWGFMSILFDEVASTITWERWEGTIEYTFMAPISRVTHLAGMCTFATLYGLLRTAIVLLFVAMFFDVSMSNANWLTATVVMLAASPAFIGLGLGTAILPLLSPERGAQAARIIQGIVLLVSGIYYPVDVLPQWLQPLSYISPGTYALESIRATILDGASLTQVWPDILALLAIALISIPVGFYIFTLAERWAMRTGKLKRNG